MMRINDSDNNHYLVNPIINLPFGDNTSKENMVRLGIVTGMVYSWDYHFQNNENQNISKSTEALHLQSRVISRRLSAKYVWTAWSPNASG